MGMAFQSLSVYHASPTFQTLINEGAVTSPVFGFKLATSDSELFLGGVNPDYEDADFTWVTLSNAVCHITSSVIRKSCVLCVLCFDRATGRHPSIRLRLKYSDPLWKSLETPRRFSTLAPL
jgi:hypothetical protein